MCLEREGKSAKGVQGVKYLIAVATSVDRGDSDKVLVVWVAAFRPPPGKCTQP